MLIDIYVVNGTIALTYKNNYYIIIIHSWCFGKIEAILNKIIDYVFEYVIPSEKFIYTFPKYNFFSSFYKNYFILDKFLLSIFLMQTQLIFSFYDLLK